MTKVQEFKKVYIIKIYENSINKILSRTPIHAESCTNILKEVTERAEFLISEKSFVSKENPGIDLTAFVELNGSQILKVENI